jgi:hypothetical protein
LATAENSRFAEVSEEFVLYKHRVNTKTIRQLGLVVYSPIDKPAPSAAN